MSKIYRYLNSRGKSLVFANTANTKDSLVATLDILNPKSLKVPIHRVQFARNNSFVIPQEEGCDPCNKQIVDLSVGVTLSGPTVAKAALLELLDEAVALLKAGAFDAQFDGFPLRVTDTYTITSE